MDVRELWRHFLEVGGVEAIPKRREKKTKTFQAESLSVPHRRLPRKRQEKVEEPARMGRPGKKEGCQLETIGHRKKPRTGGPSRKRDLNGERKEGLKETSQQGLKKCPVGVREGGGRATWTTREDCVGVG